MEGNRGKMSQGKVGVCLYASGFQDFAIIKLNVKGEAIKILFVRFISHKRGRKGGKGYFWGVIFIQEISSYSQLSEPSPLLGKRRSRGREQRQKGERNVDKTIKKGGNGARELTFESNFTGRNQKWLKETTVPFYALNCSDKGFCNTIDL